MQNNSSLAESDVNSSECVEFVMEPEHRTVETDIRFALEGVLLPVIGIVGVVGKQLETKPRWNCLPSKLI